MPDVIHLISAYLLLVDDVDEHQSSIKPVLCVSLIGRLRVREPVLGLADSIVRNTKLFPTSVVNQDNEKTGLVRERDMPKEPKCIRARRDVHCPAIRTTSSRPSAVISSVRQTTPKHHGHDAVRGPMQRECLQPGLLVASCAHSARTEHADMKVADGVSCSDAALEADITLMFITTSVSIQSNNAHSIDP